MFPFDQKTIYTGQHFNCCRRLVQFSQERSEKKVEAAASLEFHFRLLSASATAAGTRNHQIFVWIGFWWHCLLLIASTYHVFLTRVIDTFCSHLVIVIIVIDTFSSHLVILIVIVIVQLTHMISSCQWDNPTLAIQNRSEHNGTWLKRTIKDCVQHITQHRQSQSKWSLSRSKCCKFVKVLQVLHSPPS